MGFINLKKGFSIMIKNILDGCYKIIEVIELGEFVYIYLV